MKRIYRKNFPAKGKSGICRIRGCPQMGKTLKRLDNHLSRCHKGVTRGLNDNQPKRLAPENSSRSRVTCLLPGCNKEVLHFSGHLKNLHSISISEYHTKVGIRDAQNIIKKSDDNHKTGKDRLSVLLLGHHSKQMKEEVVLAEDSDVSEVDGSHDEDLKSEDLQSETGSESKWDGSSEDGFHLDVQEPCDEYDDEHLRYLVHNTTGDGIRFMLTAIEIFKHSLTKFKNSKICRVLFGDVPIVTLKDVYLHRMLLTSCYRMRSYNPYPDKDMIENCLACGATKRGSCKCPVLPKSFYVFCRGQCSSEWNCKKCCNFNAVASHVCFDFFFCKRCHEDYMSSSRHKPYP